MHRNIFSTVFFFIITLSCSLTAQEDPFEKERNKPSKPAEPVKQIRVYTECYQLSTLELAELMSNPTYNNDHTKLRNLLLAKAKKKQVTFLSNHTLIAEPSARTVSESILEYIFSTEYDPPVSPPTISPKQNDQLDIFIPKFNPFNPTAFETRNLGTSIEIETGMLDDHKTIAMRFRPEIVTHIGDSILAERHIYSSINPETVSQPIFYSVRVDTGFNLTDGKFLLSHTASPLKNKELDRSQKILTFVRAEILK